jgi:hypothetical protein
VICRGLIVDFRRFCPDDPLVFGLGPLTFNSRQTQRHAIATRDVIERAVRLFF